MLGFVLVRDQRSWQYILYFPRGIFIPLSLQFPLSPMRAFAGRIKHALHAPIESPQHADAHVHQRSAIFCGHDQRLYRSLPPGSGGLKQTHLNPDGGPLQNAKVGR
jgi:hypothetical protein